MSFEEILRAHAERYPDMQIQDVYKLIHQAALGSEHAVKHPEHARTWMFRELSEMGSGPDEPVIDPISGNTEIVRVHLRPFVAQGGNIETLLNAFVRTANEYQGKIETLESYWEISSSMLYYPVPEMDAFIRLKRTEGYPAVHHSTIFEKNYRPAYRLLPPALIVLSGLCSGCKRNLLKSFFVISEMDPSEIKKSPKTGITFCPDIWHNQACVIVKFLFDFIKSL